MALSIKKIFNQLDTHRSVRLGLIFPGLTTSEVEWRVVKLRPTKDGKTVFLCDGYYLGLFLMQCLFSFEHGALSIDPLQRGVR